MKKQIIVITIILTLTVGLMGCTENPGVQTEDTNSNSNTNTNDDTPTEDYQELLESLLENWPEELPEDFPFNLEEVDSIEDLEAIEKWLNERQQQEQDVELPSFPPFDENKLYGQWNFQSSTASFHTYDFLILSDHGKMLVKRSDYSGNFLKRDWYKMDNGNFYFNTMGEFILNMPDDNTLELYCEYKGEIATIVFLKQDNSNLVGKWQCTDGGKINPYYETSNYFILYNTGTAEEMNPRAGKIAMTHVWGYHRDTNDGILGIPTLMETEYLEVTIQSDSVITIEYTHPDYPEYHGDTMIFQKFSI